MTRWKIHLKLRTADCGLRTGLTSLWALVFLNIRSKLSCHRGNNGVVIIECGSTTSVVFVRGKPCTYCKHNGLDRASTLIFVHHPNLIYMDRVGHTPNRFYHVNNCILLGHIKEAIPFCLGWIFLLTRSLLLGFLSFWLNIRSYLEYISVQSTTSYWQFSECPCFYSTTQIENYLLAKIKMMKLPNFWHCTKLTRIT
jgi:hypothetical protein